MTENRRADRAEAEQARRAEVLAIAERVQLRVVRVEVEGKPTVELPVDEAPLDVVEAVLRSKGHI